MRNGVGCNAALVVLVILIAILPASATYDVEGWCSVGYACDGYPDLYDWSECTPGVTYTPVGCNGGEIAVCYDTGSNVTCSATPTPTPTCKQYCGVSFSSSCNSPYLSLFDEDDPLAAAWGTCGPTTYYLVNQVAAECPCSASVTPTPTQTPVITPTIPTDPTPIPTSGPDSPNTVVPVPDNAIVKDGIISVIPTLATNVSFQLDLNATRGNILNMSYIGNFSAGYLDWCDGLSATVNTAFLKVFGVANLPIAYIISGLTAVITAFAGVITLLSGLGNPVIVITGQIASTLPGKVVNVASAYLCWNIFVAVMEGR